MKLENINNDKFKKLEKYQECNLDAIRGGEEGGWTWWSSDTNPSKESCPADDTPSSYWSDATHETNDHVKTCNDSDTALPPDIIN